MKKILREIKILFNSYPDYTAANIINRIKQYPVVSFDIFDTLLKRNVESPETVFYLAAKQYSEKFQLQVRAEDIAEDRKKAESLARSKTRCKREVTLEEIYSNFPLSQAINPAELMLCELEVEKKICYVNVEIKKVFDWCVAQGKRILILSDIYYPEDYITELLFQNGYSKYNDLYVSSLSGYQKNTGRLYELVISEGIDPKTMVHIGDSFKADYIQALKNRISAIRIARNPNRTKYTRIYKMPQYTRNIWRDISKIMSGHINRKWSEYYQYGYEVLGPLLYGFSRWLHNRAMLEKVGRLFFVARDGALMQKAYNTLYKDEALDNQYFYASRTAIRMPYLYMENSIENLVSLLHGKAFVFTTIHDLARLLNIDEIYAKKIWKQCGFKEDEMINLYDYLNNSALRMLYELLKPHMEKNMKNSYLFFIEYLSQNGFEGKVAIVDIGWYGSLQKCMEKIAKKASLKVNLYGFYLGLDESINRDEHTDAFIPKGQNPGKYVSNCVEYPFMTFEGSTQGYSKNTYGKVEPIISDYEYKNCPKEQQAIANLHKGAIDFIRDMRVRDIDINGLIGYQNLKIATKFPRMKEAKLFGDLFYQEDQLRQLANPKSIFYYLLRPKQFIYEFSKCSWKPGFLKRLFKVPGPYYKALKCLTKLDKENR